MAAAAELWDSRVGDISADRSGFGASRLFKVTIDTIGDNPDDTLRDIDAVGAANAIPFGAPHPTRSGLFAAFYSTDRRLAAKVYVVRVVYAPPVDFTTPSNPWELSYQPGLSNTRVNHDWRGDPIGPANYRPIRGVMGPLPHDAEIYSVNVPSTSRRAGYKLQLVRSDAADDQPVREPVRLWDVDRTEPSGSFGMTKTFPGMQVDTMSSVVMLSNIVNRTSFFGFPPRTVKFIGPLAQAGEGIIPETNTAGYIWRIHLAFEWNSLGYRWRAQDDFRIEGELLPVIRQDGTPMLREWQLYPEGDLNVIPSLVERFGAYAQAVSIGIQNPIQGVPPPRRGG